MNHKEVELYRGNVQEKLEEMSVHHASQRSDILHIKETVDDVKTLVKEQNARIRANESAISRIQGVGSVFSVVIGGFITWLITKIR